MKIVIQAGGKGSRLEGLTRNKPKCLVPVNNLPILFHAFQKFPDAEFSIIADYKIDVLERYLAAFGSPYNYRIIKPKGKGTISGIKQAVSDFTEDEPFIIMWSDLILSDGFKIPKGNFVGISKDFECRWSYVDGKFVDKPSREQGVAGLFVFENKKLLENIPEEGALVEWLQAQNINFQELPLNGTKEIGTLIAYSEVCGDVPRYRPFNLIEFSGDTVVKQGINEQGRQIARDEIAWYRHVKELGYEFIPEIFEYEPLKMKRVQGRNIWEYDVLTRTQKRTVLKNIIDSLKKLHNLEPPQPARVEDARSNFITKTFERLDKIKALVPFADKAVIRINDHEYKNIFFNKEKFTRILESMMPQEFRLIHGDCTFSNVMFDTFNMKTVLIDPRGYFGETKFYGDADYDWAKLYYSVVGNYDQLNMKKFTLDIREDDVELAIKSNGWEDMEEFLFSELPEINKDKIKALHAVIWLSLTTYAWEDYDSICGAFYNGLMKLGEVL